jgi:hypothetical protein
MGLKKLVKIGSRIQAGVATGGLSEVGPGKSLREKYYDPLVDKGLGMDGGLGGKTIGPDAEAAELRRIKLKAAYGEEDAFDRFRKRMDEDPSQQVQYDIGQENKALSQQAEDQKRTIQDQVAQRGLGNTSLGLNAMRTAGAEASQKIGANLASFKKRLEDEKLNRLSEFRNVAGQTLSGQNVPIRFQAQKQPGLLDRLLPLGGAVAGGMLGGAPGAAVGAQLGTGFQGMYG